VLTEDPLITVFAVLLILFVGSIILVRNQTKGTDYKTDAAHRKYEDVDSISVLHAVQEGHIDSLIQEIKAAEQRANTTDDPEKTIARGLVWWTFFLAWATIVAAVVAGFTLSSIRGQLAEMQLEQRPWIPQIIFPSSIGWNNQSKDTFIMAIKYTLKNTGKLPAFSVRVEVGYYLTPGFYKNFKSPLIFQGQVCDPLRTESPDISKREGDTIFPGQEPITRGSWQQIPANDIYSNADEHRILGVIVVGCVVYKFAYDEARTHQTRFIYRVHGRLDNPYGIINAFNPDSISQVDGNWLIFAPETEYLGGGFDAD
jgi:hypothetical protein